MGYKRYVKENVRRLLYAKSGNVCAMYGCNNPLVYTNAASVNEICHIEAVNEDGARYNPHLTEEYVNSYENLILLCPTCHKKIDNKQNESLYTVHFLKQMKQFHEQQVQEILMKKAVIEPPIYLKGYDVKNIVDSFNDLYEKKVDKKYVYKVLNNILSMKIAIRSVVYGIAILCREDETEQVDVHRLNEMINLDLYTYAEILMLLEQQKVINEINYTDPLDGYETADGDWRLVQNDYLFKTTQGTWYLKKRGRLFTVICDMFDNRQDFYDFIVNRNLKMLGNLE
ncbi:HNH endonuclease signature motif containing protein [Lysinibacillus sp. FSL M8-0134]|uniref:HNH endonuclease signature motif containing protein n=1 Tax=Lysinibacillus sp. FSL M8-0134 TaxID=2921717 RepID=UPI00311A1A0D